MKKRNILDTATTPDGRRLELSEHDGRYTIKVDGLELMSTRQHASEERLAELVCGRVATRKAPKVLIGGLGFGFTLRAALQHLPANASVVVAELMPAVVAWNRNESYPLASDVLNDRRVRVIERDVATVLREGRGDYDGIMLDIDNGPAAISAEANDRIYQEMGLYEIQAALRPGGCVAFWSAAESPTFAKLLKKASFNVEIEKARANGAAGGWHTIFIGSVPEAEAKLKRR